MGQEFPVFWWVDHGQLPDEKPGLLGWIGSVRGKQLQLYEVFKEIFEQAENLKKIKGYI